MSNTDLIRSLHAANHYAKSELLTAAEEALKEHPTTVSEAELEQARHDGALSVLREMAKLKPVRHRGHPEEEVREFDNVDLSHIAYRARVSITKVWQGIP